MRLNAWPVAAVSMPSIHTRPATTAPVLASLLLTVTLVRRFSVIVEGLTETASAGLTVTTKSVVKSPNQATNSWSMRQRKWYLPGAGAVTLKAKVTVPPGATGPGTSRRLKPQAVLSCGLCEPRRTGLAPPLVQVIAPVLRIATEAL